MNYINWSIVKVKTPALRPLLCGAFCTTIFLSFVTGVSAQNLFVSCAGNNSIVEIAPGGAVNTFATGLNNPAGLAFDNAGNLFEADEGSGNVYEFINNGGTLSTTPTLFASGLDDPYGLAFTPATGGLTGGLYVSEYGNGDIADLAPGQTPLIVATGLNGPEGLLLSPPTGPAAVLSVANHGGSSITEMIFGRGNRTISVSGTPSGLAQIGGSFYYTDQQGGAVYGVNPTGQPVTMYTVVSGLNDPSGLVASGNNLFEADTGSGEINELIGQAGSGAFTETNFVSGLDEPVGLAVQPAPEPSEWGLLAVGVMGFIVRRWRR